MTKLPQQHHAEAVARAEALLALLNRDAHHLLNGLADRPKPGAKQKAREVATAILKESYEVYRFIEGHTPVRIVCSGEESAS